jgi:hypothetical protein
MVEIRIHPERLLTPKGEKVLNGCVSDAVLVTVRRWCAGGVDGWTQLDTCQVGSRCRVPTQPQCLLVFGRCHYRFPICRYQVGA